MFSFISKNWAAQPLVDYETVLNFISSTETETGLTIKACLIDKQYEKGIKISEGQMRGLSIKRHTLRPNWNYSICPSKM